MPFDVSVGGRSISYQNHNRNNAGQSENVGEVTGLSARERKAENTNSIPQPYVMALTADLQSA